MCSICINTFRDGTDTSTSKAAVMATSAHLLVICSSYLIILHCGKGQPSLIIQINIHNNSSTNTNNKMSDVDNADNAMLLQKL